MPTLVAGLILDGPASSYSWFGIFHAGRMRTISIATFSVDGMYTNCVQLPVVKIADQVSCSRSSSGRSGFGFAVITETPILHQYLVAVHWRFAELQGGDKDVALDNLPLDPRRQRSPVSGMTHKAVFRHDACGGDRTTRSWLVAEGRKAPATPCQWR